MLTMWINEFMSYFCFKVVDNLSNSFPQYKKAIFSITTYALSVLNKLTALITTTSPKIY